MRPRECMNSFSHHHYLAMLPLVCFARQLRKKGEVDLHEKNMFIPLLLEANHSYDRGLPLFFPTDSHPWSLSYLLQNHVSSCQAIGAYAQEV